MKKSLFISQFLELLSQIVILCVGFFLLIIGGIYATEGLNVLSFVQLQTTKGAYILLLAGIILLAYGLYLLDRFEKKWYYQIE